MDREELNRKIDTLYAYDDRMKRFNGYILIKKGEELFSKGYGLANYSIGAVINHDTIFLIGSLTKVFTSTCIMMLEKSGLLNTNDRLERYLPQYTKASKVTIGQLLNHTSGIPDYWNRVGISSIDYNDVYDIFRFIMDFDLIETPGEVFRYCNSNYLILAILIETVTGISYDEFMRTNILSPLNMTRTGLIPDYHRFDNVAVGYKMLLPTPKEAAKPENTIIFGNMLGAGCLFSTANDLMKFSTALFGGELLECNNLRKMFKPNLDGYGWFIENDKVWHGGDICGFSVRMTYFLTDGSLIIMLCNTDGKKEAHMGHFAGLIESCLSDDK